MDDDLPSSLPPEMIVPTKIGGMFMACFGYESDGGADAVSIGDAMAGSGLRVGRHAASRGVTDPDRSAPRPRCQPRLGAKSCNARGSPESQSGRRLTRGGSDRQCESGGRPRPHRSRASPDHKYSIASQVDLPRERCENHTLEHA